MNKMGLTASLRSDVLEMDQPEEAGASDFDYAHEFESDYGAKKSPAPGLPKLDMHSMNKNTNSYSFLPVIKGVNQLPRGSLLPGGSGKVSNASYQSRNEESGFKRDGGLNQYNSQA